MTVGVMCLFLTVPLVGLLCVIIYVVLPGHKRLLYDIISSITQQNKSLRSAIFHI